MAYSILHFNDPDTGGRAKVSVIMTELGLCEVRVDATWPYPELGARTPIRWETIEPFIGWDP